MPTTPYRGRSSTVSQLLRGTKSHSVLKLGVLCMRGTKTILPSSRHSMTIGKCGQVQQPSLWFMCTVDSDTTRVPFYLPLDQVLQ